MSAIINGSSPSVTFSDGTTQATSAIVSGYVPYANLPAGSVLQVVQATYNVQVANSTTTAADTGLTATITPKFATSKILVLVTQNGSAWNNTARTDTGFNLYLQRNGATIYDGSPSPSLYWYNSTNGNYQISANIPITYLDSPATTSALTYKTQFSCTFASTRTFACSSNQVSTIQLLEIAA